MNPLSPVSYSLVTSLPIRANAPRFAAASPSPASAPDQNTPGLTRRFFAFATNAVKTFFRTLWNWITWKQLPAPTAQAGNPGGPDNTQPAKSPAGSLRIPVPPAVSVALQKTQRYAREQLAQCYEQLSRRQDATASLAGKHQFQSPQFVYKDWAYRVYNQIRLANYSSEIRQQPNLDAYTGRGNKLIQNPDQASPNPSWHFRMPRNQKGWTSQLDRVSVNAFGTEKLIDALDNLFGSGKVKGYYKVPNDGTSWSDRHDSITIYLKEPLTPAIEAKLEEITRRFIRSTKPVLQGRRFAPGLAAEKSPTQQQMKHLIERATLIDPAMREAVLDKFTDTYVDGERIYKTSTGEFASYQKIITTMEKARAIKRAG